MLILGEENTGVVFNAISTDKKKKKQLSDKTYFLSQGQGI